MNVFDLAAKLTLDTSEYSKSLKEAENEAQNAGNSVGTGMSKAAKIGAAALVTAGTAVTAFAADAVKTGMQFDSSMSQVAATMGTTVDEIGELRDFAKDMGATTAFSATQAADALNYMALAGYDAETSMAVLPNVLNLAAAGGIELAQASDMVTDAQSALGLSLDETSQLVDKMAKASSKSNTSVAQLGDAILTIGGTAKSMAGGTTELSAALGILADNGIKGAEGGTALRNVLLGIQSDKFEQTFGAWGISAYDAEGNLRELSDILADMNTVMAGMTDQEKTNLINEIFNRQDLKTVNALLATSTERWDELTDAIDNSAGAAGQMADTQLDNLSGSITMLKSALEGAKIELSDKLAPALKTLVDWLTKLVQNADTVLPIIIGLGVAFGTFAVALNIGSIIQGVTKSMAALNAVLMANPIGIVIALVAGLVAVFVTLWNTNEEFREKVTEIWNNIKATAEEVFGAVKEFFENTFGAIRDFVTETVETIKTNVTDKWEEIKTNVTEKVEEIKSNIEEKWENIKTTISDKLENIKSNTQERLNEIKTAYAEHGGGVQGIVAAGWTALQQAYETGYNVLNRITNGKLEEVRQAVVNFWQRFKDAGANLVQGLVAGATENARALIDAVSGAVSNAIAAAKRLLGIASPSKVFMQFGRFMDEGLAQGIERFASKPINAVKELTDGVTGAFDGDLNISATSRQSRSPYDETYDRPIILQVLLDGKVIGETSYNYIRRRTRMVGA